MTVTKGKLASWHPGEGGGALHLSPNFTWTHSAIMAASVKQAVPGCSP